MAAQVPILDAPSVPQSAQPTPRVNVSAPPEAFGLTTLGKGLSELGQAANQVSENQFGYAKMVQALDNKSAADKAYSQSLTDINTYEENYRTNNLGEKAAPGLAGAFKDLDAMRQKNAEGLSPLAQSMYDADSRRMLAAAKVSLSTFAAGEQKKVQLAGFDSKIDALSSDSVLHPQNFEANLAQQSQVWASKDLALGVPPDVGAQAQRERVGKEVQKVAVATAAVGKPDEALAFVEQHKEAMDGNTYADTLRQLHPAVQANQVAKIGMAAADQAVAQAGGPNEGYFANVNAREGAGRNPRSSAEGVGQFLSGTWLKLLKSDPTFANDIAGKSDSEILALRKDPNIARMAIGEYAKQNAPILSAAGFQPTDAFLGLAHGFGPQGAIDILRSNGNTPLEKVLPPAVMAANPDLKGKTSGQLVSQFKARFGEGIQGDTISGVPSSYALAAQLDSARSTAMSAMAAQGGDAQAQEAAANNAETQLRRRVEEARYREADSYQTLTSAIQANTGIQDMDALFKSVPGALLAYNSLPRAQRDGIRTELNHNANDVTPERQANLMRLAGEYGTRNVDPAFGNENIQELDIPRNAKVSWLQRQAQFRSRAQTQVDEGALLTKMLNDPRVGPTMQQLGIKPGSTEYYQFLGTLDTELQAAQGAQPRHLSDQDKMGAFNRAVAKTTQYNAGFFGIGVGQRFTGPPGMTPQVRQQIITMLNARGIPPNEYNITRQFYAGRTPLND